MLSLESSRTFRLGWSNHRTNPLMGERRSNSKVALCCVDQQERSERSVVTINYPDVAQNNFILYRDCIVGPYSSTSTDSSTNLEFRSRFDQIFQGPRYRLHEKSVSHKTAKAVFNYRPIWNVLVRSSTTQAPLRTRFYYRSTAYALCLYGYLPFNGKSGYVKLTTTTLIHTILDQTPTGFNMYQVTFNTSTRAIITVEKYICTVSGNLVADASKSIPEVYQKWVCQYNQDLPTGNWSMRHDFLTIMSLVDKGIAKGVAQAPVTRTVGCYVRQPYGMSGQTPQQLRFTVEDLIGSMSLEKYTFPPCDWGKLAHEASVSLNQTDTNVIAFLRDIRHLRDLIPKLKNLASLKTMSSNYLMIKYGWLPTVSDLNKIFSSLRRLRVHRFDGITSGYSSEIESLVTSQGTEITSSRHLKLMVRTNDSQLSELSSRIESLGLFPNLKSIWDLIPYSFVLDWFIDVGDFLERADSHLRTLRYPIVCVVQSEKIVRSRTLVSDIGSTLDGSASVVEYHRWASDQCSLPTLTYLSSQLDASNHWLEATALLIQRAR